MNKRVHSLTALPLSLLFFCCELFLVIFIFHGHCLAEEQLEEATGLSDEAEPKQIPPTSNLWSEKIRAYLLVEAMQEKLKSGLTKSYFPNGEFGFTGKYSPCNGCELFGDATLYEDKKIEKRDYFVNQIGFRYGYKYWQIALGKERNRRTSTLFISPADWVQPASDTPGVREERNGVWLVRNSIQFEKQSIGFTFYPDLNSDDKGFIKLGDDKIQATQISYFQQFKNIDLSITIGSKKNKKQAGLMIQGFLNKDWKLYYEGGYAEEETFLLFKREGVRSDLIGLSFEGSSDWSFKIEYLNQNSGVTDKELDQLIQTATITGKKMDFGDLLNPFLRQKYLLTSFSLIELNNRFNLIFSVAKSLEDDGLFLINRGEWLATDTLVAGITARHLTGSDSSQYGMRSWDQIIACDVKLSF